MTWVRGRGVATLAAWLWMSLCAHADSPPARAGVLALDRAPAEAVELRGHWLFAWERFIDPQAPWPELPSVPVPAAWNESVRGAKPAAPYQSHGHASYALRVDCPAGTSLALAVPAQRSAMRLYVHGRLAVSQGTPGRTAEEAVPAIGPRAVVTESFPCPLAIVAHVSNFSHRAGGLVRAPAAGPHDVLLADMKERLVANTVLLGAFLVLGLVPILFHFARRKDVTPLYFGLFCLTLATYSDMTGERLLLLLAGPQVGWEAYLRTEYLAWFASMVCFLLLVARLFPAEVPRVPHRVLAVACGACIAAVLVTPARIYSHLAPAGQLITVAIDVMVIWTLLHATRRGRAGARVLLAGMVFMLAVIVVDLLRYTGGLSTRSITPFGTLVFVLAPAIVLARRLARALNAEELRALEQRVTGDLLVRTTKAGIYDWDTTTHRTTYSERLKEILGHPPDADTSGWPVFYELIHPDDRREVQERFLQQLRECTVASGEMRHVPYEYRLVRADGTPVWVMAEAISLTGSDCRTLRYICSFIDITERHALQERLTASRDEVAAQARQLLAQNAALEENARLREDVERISRHDLKTPLNSIIGATRLLRDDAGLGGEQRELLGIVERAGLRMLEMVNLSLGLFRMEMGSYDFRPQAVQMQELLRRVLQDTRSHAEANRVAVRLRGDFDAPVYARAEELLCYSILANLAKNAVEATPAGGTVTITLQAGSPVRVHVHNPGRVPPAVAARFFEKYVTAGKSGGTGLGTYSARLMACAQEGDLAMATGDAEGTTLTLTLKGLSADALPVVAEAAEATRAGTPALVFAARHVLVVDDDEFTRLIVRRFLPSPPLTIETAVNGHAAIETVQRRWPDIVVIDMEMPVMNGLDAVAWIREREREDNRPRCRIVMMSSNDDEASMRRAAQAGADRYLTKPVTREVLLAALGELEAAAGRAMPPPIRTKPPAPDAEVEIDPDLSPEIPAFLRSRRELADEMAQALSEGDRERLRGLAHRAAGGLALYGFRWAAWQSREIESGALAGEPQALRSGIDALARHLGEVRVRSAPPDS